MTQEADVARSLVEMGDTLVDDYDVVDLLTGVADRGVSLLGVSAAGVMLASPAGRHSGGWHTDEPSQPECGGGGRSTTLSASPAFLRRGRRCRCRRAW
jgi:hypothetical protein